MTFFYLLCATALKKDLKKSFFRVFITISDEFGSLLVEKVQKISNWSLAFEKITKF